MPESKLFQAQATYEPVLRVMLAGLDQSIVKTAALPVTNYSHYLDEAVRDMQEAARRLRQWADAHDICLHESMPT